MKTPRPYRLAYLVSHPIQYQAPLLRYITQNEEIDLTVFFLSDFSVKGYKDEGFGSDVTWDVPLLDGYKYEFLSSWGDNAPVTSTRPISRGVWHRLRRGNFDAIWMHGYAHVSNLRALAAAKTLGMKVLLRAESQLGSALRDSRTQAVKQAALRKVLSQADGFLTIGSLNREYYNHYGISQDRLFSMPYAVDNSFFQAQVAARHPQREKLRAELGLEPNRPIILYASKFIQRKRAGDVLEAYAKLSPDGKSEPNAYLLFIGDGEQRPQLEARAKELGWDGIRFLGFKNQTELPAYYDLCDVFILVSEQEPWGLVVNEVMNAAKPVIVSDGVGSARDLVRDGVNGYVVPIGDIEKTCQSMRAIIDDPENAKKMGEAGRQIIDNWGFKEDLDGLLEALHTLLPRDKA